MKPLAHLRVLDLTVNMPGPFCSMILADLGARVIKVEPPGGDPLRHTPGMFASVNRGKQSLVLNLKVSGAQVLLERFAGTCDVVLEGWRPGVAARLGADYATLSRRNPRLIYCSISGFAQAGPWRERPAHDVNYLALGGYLGVQAVLEGRPWPPPVLISDLAAGSTPRSPSSPRSPDARCRGRDPILTWRWPMRSWRFSARRSGAPRWRARPHLIRT